MSSTKPWLPREKVEEVLAKVNDLRDWISENL